MHVHDGSASLLPGVSFTTLLRGGDELVGPVAPGLPLGLVATADRHHRAGDRVFHAVLVGPGLGSADQERPAGTLLESSLATARSEEHTSELQSLMRTSYAVFCLKKKKK